MLTSHNKCKLCWPKTFFCKKTKSRHFD